MSLQQKLISRFPDRRRQGILILDSGIGGVSFIPGLNKLLPYVPISVFADQEFFPYGEKEEEQIISRLIEITDPLVKSLNPSVILVGCNTASTIVLPALREKFKIPIVGVVPAIKPAAQISQTKKIALLATPGTISRSYIQNLINEFAAGCEIIRVNCANLASLAELKMLQGEDVYEQVEEELLSLRYEDQFLNVDTLILGCTHFTFLEKEITAALKKDFNVLDPIESVCRQVKKVGTFKPCTLSGSTLIVSEKFSKYKNLQTSFSGIDSIIFV